jgi:hypothetical protein
MIKEIEQAEIGGVRMFLNVVDGTSIRTVQHFRPDHAQCSTVMTKSIDTWMSFKY